MGPCLRAGACEVFCEAANSLTAVLISDCFGFWAFIQDRKGGKTDRSWGMRTSALTELEGSMVKISAGVYRADFCLSASWWGCASMEMWRGNYIRRTEQYADITWTVWSHQHQVTEACITLHDVFCRKDQCLLRGGFTHHIGWLYAINTKACVKWGTKSLNLFANEAKSVSHDTS